MTSCRPLRSFGGSYREVRPTSASHGACGLTSRTRPSSSSSPLHGPYARRSATRRWRADFAHLPTRTLIEIEGGIFMRRGGRHTRGAGYAKDAEKYLEAVMAGWTVLRLTERQLEIGLIERIVAWLSTPPAEERR